MSTEFSNLASESITPIPLKICGKRMKHDETITNWVSTDPAGLDLVLDLDAADPQQEMVFLWKKLPGHRPNQLWQLQQMGPERYTLRSLCNSLRFMMSCFLYVFYIFLCLQYFFIF